MRSRERLFSLRPKRVEMINYKKPEILAPCGSYDILIAAINAGADACYFGGNKFGARAYATNFDLDTSIKAIQYAHIHGVRLYLTVNTLFKEDEIKELYDFIRPYYEAGLDAVIVQDLGVFKYIKEYFPDMHIHCSTQMNITSKFAARAMRDMGASRIVTAREMSLQEIADIKKENDIEIESFVHGAMCYSYSGRCLMSSLAGGRSGNRGRCAQPCRRSYDGEYILSMKDMCTLTDIPKLIEAGIDSLKIEGRMKNEYYVASAVDAYNQIAEDFVNGCYSEKKAHEYKLKLANIYNRGGFCGGYYYMHNGPDMISKDRPNNQGVPIGTITQVREGQIGLKLSYDLYKQDVIELKLKDDNIIEITSGIEGKKGDTVYLNSPKTKFIVREQVALRTRSNKIIQSIQDKIIDRDIRYGLNGCLQAKIGEKLSFTVGRQVFDKYYEATSYGDVVDRANSREANLDDIRNKVGMLGNTCYKLDSLELDVDRNAFVPASALKRLRREAIDAMEAKIIQSFARDLGSFRDNSKLLYQDETETQPTSGEIGFIVGVTTIDQLTAVNDSSCVNCLVMTPELYVLAEKNGVIAGILTKGCNIYIDLPYIVNNSFKLADYLPNESIDGIYIRNIDCLFAYLEYAKDNSEVHKLNVICGDGLYVYNTYSRSFIKELVPNAFFELPRELAKDELKDLCGANNHLVCYEYQQAMLSAQCVVKNKLGCNKAGDIIKLRDDKKNVFYAKANCKECNNIIYNGVPYMILDQLTCGYLADIGVNGLRANFTIEDKSTTKAVLQLLEVYSQGDDVAKSVRNGSNTYTSGHFNRGV